MKKKFQIDIEKILYTAQKESYLDKVWNSKEIVKINEKEYWENLAKGAKVNPLSKPCKDCAITTGFYSHHAESLKNQSKDLQNRAACTWFCHNNCNRGCAGIIEFLK